MKYILIVLAALTTMSCAVSYKTATDRFEAAKSCCSKLSELTYESIAIEQPVAFDLNDTSDVFLFSTGKSYIKAFKLPVLDLPHRIRIRSYALGDRVDRAHIFYPKILLLSEAFEIIEDLDPVLSLQRAGYGDAVAENKWGLPVRLEGEIQIDKPEQRYLVVLTTEKLLSSSTRYVQTITGIAAPAGAVGLVPQGAFEIRHSPFGRIVLQIM